MITEDEFISSRQPEWNELSSLVIADAMHKRPGPAISRAFALYRAVCADLMRARAAGYGGETVAFLDALAARAHGVLYTAPPYRFGAARDLMLRDFPRTLRREWRFFVLAALLFLAPALLGFVEARGSATFAMQVLPESTIAEMEEAYSKAFTGRDAGTNMGMAGFYVFNNVGIAFRCFATGVLFGLGSAFFLVYNGLVVGVVAGVLARTGHWLNLVTFMCGHSPFELVAIVISGAAGMRMGYALVVTEGRTRWGSVRAVSRDIAHLILGAAAMLLVAAGIEGFWSPSSVPAPVKWGVAGCLSVGVAAYLALAGRSTPEARA
jgi:uncharacterized membrane protein SpoIIM required for sporulation